MRALSPYLSEVNSLAMLSARARAMGLEREQLGPKHLPEILAQVRSSFAFFGISPDRRDSCLQQLRALAGAEGSGARDKDTLTIPVEQEQDIVRARLSGKAFCQQLGFSEIGSTKVMTAISELARNIYKYGVRGLIHISRVPGERVCVQVIAADRGPGIRDIARVLSPNFVSQTGMGRGLRGTRSIMDSFDIQSRPGEGTVVTVQKYLS